MVMLQKRECVLEAPPAKSHSAALLYTHLRAFLELSVDEYSILYILTLARYTSLWPLGG